MGGCDSKDSSAGPTTLVYSNTRTGDCVFFAEFSTPSRFRKTPTWSSVGVVLCLQDLYPNRPLLLESAPNYSDNLLDVRTGAATPSGVRLVDLQARIVSAQEQSVDYFPWDPISTHPRIADVDIFNFANSSCTRTPSDSQRAALIYTGPENPPSSETLAANCLQTLHILKPTKPANRYSMRELRSSRLKTASGTYLAAIHVKCPH